jgi:hypothetical protein
VDGTGTVACLIAGCGIGGVEPSDSVLVLNYEYGQMRKAAVVTNCG